MLTFAFARRRRRPLGDESSTIRARLGVSARFARLYLCPTTHADNETMSLVVGDACPIVPPASRRRCASSDRVLVSQIIILRRCCRPTNIHRFEINPKLHPNPASTGPSVSSGDPRCRSTRAREHIFVDARRGLLLTVVFFEKFKSNARQSTTRVREANGIDEWTLELKSRVAYRVLKNGLNRRRTSSFGLVQFGLVYTQTANR